MLRRPPSTPCRSDAMSAVRCRYLRGASGPLGRPWVAITACRRGSKVIVSAALVSARCHCGAQRRCCQAAPSAAAAVLPIHSCWARTR